MLDFWEAEARADGINEEVIQAVEQRLRSYDGLSPQSRADALKGLWKRIGDTYPETQQRSGQRPQQSQPRPHPAQQQSQPTGEQPKPRSEPQATEPRHQEQPKPRPMPTPRTESVPGAKHSQTPAALNAPLTVLQGVGSRHAQTLAELGMQTLGDMLYYFPRRYEDYSQLKPIKSLWYGEQVTVIGTIQSVHTRPISRRLSFNHRSYSQRWHGRTATLLVQPTVDGESTQRRNADFRFGNGRAISWSPRDEPTRLGTGGHRASAHQSHRAHLSAHGQDHAEVASQSDESSRHVLGARSGRLAA